MFNIDVIAMLRTDAAKKLSASNTDVKSALTMSITNFRILIFLVLSIMAMTQSSHCVKQSFNDLTRGDFNDLTLVDTNEGNLSQEEMAEAGLLKYAGVFGGPADYSEIDESGRSKRVKRYKA